MVIATGLIKRYNLTEVLGGDRTLFNVNNLWSDKGKPYDYESKQKLGNTRNWVDLFHHNVPRLSLDRDDIKWIQEAFAIGCITGRFPKMYEDELSNTCEKHRLKYPSLNDSLHKGYFIRTEHVSLKHGCHGNRPYTDIKSIIESIVTTTYGHSCINPAFADGRLTGVGPEDNICNIYFIEWIDNYDEEKEFRVFVCDNRITAISTQNIYKINTWLNALTDQEILDIICDMTAFFCNNIRDKLSFISSYVMDIYYRGPNNWYFIEPNCFGAEYPSGSALFHWNSDSDLLNGNVDYIELRYVSGK